MTTAPELARSETRAQRWKSAKSLAAVTIVLVTLWELYKAIWTALGIITPVRPDNVTMPHVWDIILELFEPATRGGEALILALAKAALYTLGEAFVGFVVGGVIGFGFGVLFVRSRLAEKAFMPYIVASQTVPILALAPMVVIWGRQLDVPDWVVVSVIATYLTFFPVTINTVRGLRSPPATAIELMRSYAATPKEVLWKLRVPAALPYIFTSLKISATASVIGAIIGELPGGIRNGLGRAILEFASRFAIVSPKLYATLLITCLAGLGFVGLVTLAERKFLVASHRQVG
jgi:NitT/TauT family transport system permease protein